MCAPDASCCQCSRHPTAPSASRNSLRYEKNPRTTCRTSNPRQVNRVSITAEVGDDDDTSQTQPIKNASQRAKHGGFFHQSGVTVGFIGVLRCIVVGHSLLALNLLADSGCRRTVSCEAKVPPERVIMWPARGRMRTTLRNQRGARGASPL